MAVSELDYYDYLAMPNQDIREQAMAVFFDTYQLHINDENVKKTYGGKIRIQGFNALFNFDQALNNHILERLRSFNNSIIFITLAIQKMYNYKLLIEAETNKDISLIRESIYRNSVRNVCIELCIYEEKIKNLLRYLYDLDDKKTMDNSLLFSELSKLSKNDPMLKDLLDSCDKFHKAKSYNIVDDIRNNEVHNKSLLDSYTHYMDIEGGKAITNPRYSIQTAFLYPIIQTYLNEVIDVKNKLQIIIDNYVIR